MTDQLLGAVDVIIGFLLMGLGALRLAHAGPRWMIWPRRLRDDPTALRWSGVLPTIFGAFIGTLELLLLTGNARAMVYVLFPVIGLVTVVALAAAWTGGRAVR